MWVIERQAASGMVSATLFFDVVELVVSMKIVEGSESSFRQMFESGTMDGSDQRSRDLLFCIATGNES